ncbi:MAG: hypothetical protein ACO1PM_28325, partial [Acidovorax sp.]
LKKKKRLNKAGTETIPEPGSVSRLAGSAHRWVELYAARVQRKTSQSRIDCSSFGNSHGWSKTGPQASSEAPGRPAPRRIHIPI